MILAPDRNQDQPTAAEAIARPAGAVVSDSPAPAREAGPDTFNGHRTAVRDGSTQQSNPVPVHPCLGEKEPAQVPVGGHQFEAGALQMASSCSASLVESTTEVGQQPAPASFDPFNSSDEWRITEANRRIELVQTYRALMAEQQMSGKQAAEAMGEDVSTMWRYNKAFEAGGYNALIPNTDKCGRKSEVQKLRDLLGDEEVDRILAEIKGINLDTESTTAALRLYAHSDKCPAGLADLILDPNRCSKHALPPSLRGAVTIPKPQKLAHRGNRALSLKGFYTPRKNDILGGDIFTSDDTTPIWAWWVPWQESEEYPFGVKLLQGQYLPLMDVARQCVISAALIAREKSSYRASDIWGLFGHTFDQIGLPRLGFQLERGSWESNCIRGQEVTFEQDEVTMERRVGGLRQLPTNLTDWHREKLGPDASQCFPETLQTWTSYLPKSKSIEAAFNRMQTFEGTLWGCLGRDQMRKPFEKAKKLFQQCSRPRAKIDPREHFLSQTEMLQRLKGLLEYMNNEPMEGEVFCGIPQQRFQNDVGQYPLYRLPEDMRWLYTREWRAVTITQGHARVRLTDEITGQRFSLWYTNPAVFAEIEGVEVFVYYDKERFDEPAQIVAAKPCYVRGERIAAGKFICAAQFEERVGSFLDGEQNAHELRKAWRNAVTTAYATIVPHAPSRQLPREIEQRRAESKAESRESSAGAGSPSTGIEQRSVKPSTLGVRPSTKLLPAPTPDAWQKQQQRLSRQAKQANRLRALTNT